MQFSSAPRSDGVVVERDLTIDGVPGILWTPERPDRPTPLLLLGHPGDLRSMRPRLAGRARRAAVDGFAAATIELPGSGGLPPLPDVEQARADLRRALRAGEPVGGELVDRLVLPLVERAVPAWRSLLDVLLPLPGMGAAAAYSGGFTAIGVRLALVEPRLRALSLFAGSYIPARTFEEAGRITLPLHVLLQWDDEGNDRQASLDLFDAFASSEKTLQANIGGHRGVPEFAGEDAARFLVRHLR